jgi:hypothetical protein
MPRGHPPYRRQRSSREAQSVGDCQILHPKMLWWSRFNRRSTRRGFMMWSGGPTSPGNCRSRAYLGWRQRSSRCPPGTPLCRRIGGGNVQARQLRPTQSRAGLSWRAWTSSTFKSERATGSSSTWRARWAGFGVCRFLCGHTLPSPGGQMRRASLRELSSGVSRATGI